MAILNVAADLGIGLTQFVSMGNKADVSGNDLLEHWEDDPATRVIAMYLESFGNPRRFTEIAKRVDAQEADPGGQVRAHREGARAASSHTGAIAGADVTVSAFLDQCGVLRANTIEELFDVARALDRCPLPAGRRVAIVTNAGGPAIMATDACVNLGLEIAELSEKTRARRCASFLPAEASVGNPVDMIASADAEQYGRALAAVLDDPGVDMAMVINVTPLLTDPGDVLERVAEAARDGGAAKPVLAVMMATDEFYERMKHRRDLPPVYRFPESAARAMQMLDRYAAWRAPAARRGRAGVRGRRRRGRRDPGRDRRRLPAGRGRLPGARPLRRPARRLAPDRRPRGGAGGGARDRLSRSLSRPMAPGLVHKSEVGAVAIDLRDEAELAAALDRMAASVGAAGYEVEAFAGPGDGRAAATR